jgi:hypothetical protein
MTIARAFKGVTVTRTKATPALQQKSAAAARRERLEGEAEIAGYIAQLSEELASMAQAARFELVAYFLSMAKMEADAIARRPLLEDLHP